MVAGGYDRTLTGLYQLQADQTSSVQVFVNAKEVLSQTLTSPRLPPAAVTAVVRTPTVWVDRAELRISFLLTDAKGSQLVSTTGVNVVYSLTRADGAVLQGSCVVPADPDDQIGYCSSNSLFPSWFSSDLDVDVEVSAFLGSDLLASASLPGSLRFIQQPTWYDASLRSPSNGLGIPEGPYLQRGGVFATLPASSLYAMEPFDVFVYANTRVLDLGASSGTVIHQLVAWTVEVFYSDALLECDGSCASAVSFNSNFKQPSVQYSDGAIAATSADVVSSAEPADTSGSAVYILKLRLRFKSSAAAGSYGSTQLGLRVRAETLVNDGGYAFVDTGGVGSQDGLTFDGRDDGHSYGLLVVQEVVPTGIFAYITEPVLLNTARLGSEVALYTPTVRVVTSDSRCAPSSSRLRLTDRAQASIGSSRAPHMPVTATPCAGPQVRDSGARAIGQQLRQPRQR